MASSPQHEPTMEEILASIRKIISEDSTEAPAAPAPVAAEATAPAMDADVLELTQEMPEERAPSITAPVRAPATAPKPENDVVFQTVEETTVTASAPAHDDIFSDKTRK